MIEEDVLFWFAFVLGGCLVLVFVFGSLHLGFLHGFRLGPIGFLPVYHRRLNDRQSLERARHELKKKKHLIEEESTYVDLSLNHWKCCYIAYNCQGQVFFQNGDRMTSIDEAKY